MTRDEFDRQWENIDIVQGCSIGYNCSQTDNIVDAYVDTLEARIAELEALQSRYDNGQLQYYKLWDMYSDLKKQLEPKNCDGCKWYIPQDVHRNYCDNVNSHICVRYDFNDIDDFYEPKDSI
jgi:hypothetical protein